MNDVPLGPYKTECQTQAVYMGLYGSPMYLVKAIPKGDALSLIAVMSVRNVDRGVVRKT